LPFGIASRLKIGSQPLDSFRGLIGDGVAETRKKLGERCFENCFEGEGCAEQWQTAVCFVAREQRTVFFAE
jgi:hypothetical protein